MFNFSPLCMGRVSVQPKIRTPKQNWKRQNMHFQQPVIETGTSVSNAREYLQVLHPRSQSQCRLERRGWALQTVLYYTLCTITNEGITIRLNTKLHARISSFRQSNTEKPTSEWPLTPRKARFALIPSNSLAISMN